MSQTLTRLLIHLIFSTRNREPLITADVEPELHAYLGGIARNLESPALAIGGVEDHVHLLVSLSKNVALARFVMELKRDSSKWIKTKGPSFSTFAWQDGYGAFTIGESQVAALTRYIAAQKEHHRRRTYQEEFIALLTKYGVVYDDRYVWG